MSGHVTGLAAWDGEKLRLVDPVVFNAGMRRLKPGNGETFVIRVEREAEAWRHSDVKHLFGHVYLPVVEYTGYTKTELHTIAKGLWMPDGKTSLTELDREEIQEYTRLVDRWLREECWQAFERPDAA